MANRKITQFPAFNGVDIQPDDLLTLVHVFEVDPSLKNKKITFTEFRNYLNQFYVTSTGVTGNVTIKGDLTVTGDLSASEGEFNNLRIIDDNDVLVANISGDDNGSASFASGAFTIADDGDTVTSGTLGVSGIFTIASGLSANGNIGTSGFFLKSRGPGQPAVWDRVDTQEVTLTGNVQVSGTLTVTGNTTVSGLLTASGLTVTGNGQFNNISVVDDNNALVAQISGDDNGSASFASGAFTIANDGDTVTSGTLGVSGLFTIASGLIADGTVGTSGFFLASNGPGQPAAWEAVPGTAPGGDAVFDTVTARSGITNSGNLTTSGITVTGGTAIFNSGISVTGDSTFSGLVTASGITATGTISGQVFVVTIGQGSVGLDMGSGTISGSANGPIGPATQDSVIVRGPLVILP